MNGLFDKQNLKMNVNIQGTFDDYMRYKKSQKISRKAWLNIMLFSGIAVGGFIMAIGVHSMFYVEPAPSTFLHDFLQVALTGTQMSWSSFAKFFLVLMMPVIAVSWLFHGVQARLLA